VSAFRWRPDPNSPRAANVRAVIDRAEQVASLVGSAPAEDTVLVLGGDCTVGVGSVAGLGAHSDKLGLVYVDRHSDLNVPGSTVDGALDWMGVAHILDIEGAVPEFAAIGAERPMLGPGQISFLGLGPHTDFEATVIADRRLPVVSVVHATADPRGGARVALSPLAACDVLAIHFDVDLVDFLDAPLAENTDRGTAPSLIACGEMLSELMADSRARSLTVTEFNPHHGSHDGTSTRRLVEVLIHTLSATW
jgi:arginase